MPERLVRNSAGRRNAGSAEQRRRGRDSVQLGKHPVEDQHVVPRRFDASKEACLAVGARTSTCRAPAPSRLSLTRRLAMSLSSSTIRIFMSPAGRAGSSSSSPPTTFLLIICAPPPRLATGRSALAAFSRRPTTSSTRPERRTNSSPPPILPPIRRRDPRRRPLCAPGPAWRPGLRGRRCRRDRPWDNAGEDEIADIDMSLLQSGALRARRCLFRWGRAIMAAQNSVMPLRGSRNPLRGETSTAIANEFLCAGP